MEPLVSVIIPVYNVRPYLCEALDSVLGQTYQNLEILVIDDGSDDGSERICDEYGKKDSRITVIHQENRGLSTARNVGLNRVTGEYVAFLDPDDAFHPDMIRRLMEAMKRNGAEMAVCGIINCHSLHRMQGKRFFLRAEYRQEEVFEKKASLALLAEGRMASCVWNKLYTAELWKTIRFPDGHVHEDGCTLIQSIGMADRVVTVPDCPVRYRIRPGSITRTWSVQNARDWLWARKQMEDYVEENTPELFEPGTLGQMRNQTIHGMVSAWTRVRKNDREYADNLRHEILERGRSHDRGSWDLRSRTAYQMLRSCPWMVPILLPVYQFARQLYTGMTGR